MGAGRTEVARLLFGADKKIAEPLKLMVKRLILKSLKMLLKKVLVIFQRDRKRYGCIVDMTIANNTVMTNLISTLRVV